MTDNNVKSRSVTRTIVVLAVVGGAFFGAFQLAQARSSGVAASGTGGLTGATQASTAGGSGTPACACCSSASVVDGLSGDRVEGTAQLAEGVQSIDVDLSTGVYNPNVIVLKAGVPAQITFGQSSGCTAQVLSKDLGFFEDLTTGAKTIKLPALDAGEYAFSCGMEMVFGKIIVQ
jgi:hypothetical protein